MFCHPVLRHGISTQCPGVQDLFHLMIIERSRVGARDDEAYEIPKDNSQNTLLATLLVTSDVPIV
ncbi:MAG: hypothetical protein JWO44_1718 [Bacteroidetes bacterium]|nr:hypothetical protein [Bacteroidota bacterium]